ncbi:hypothetical protein BKA66DRAFT_573253 [Pyrenochaeta sp. MPI-SDFR-AT-0127]|nr:hypothetical protein BKA66DRAFT_573253 [Pyrenochaeta sp. MPI-SDFR-AT-0127]
MTEADHVISSGSSPQLGTTNSDTPIQKSFSCVVCASRKVRCDRRPGGCENCTKARVSCVYKAPPPPRRRKKGVRDVDTTTRLRLYEDALRQLGVDPERLVAHGIPRQKRQEVSGINGFLESSRQQSEPQISASSENGVLVLDDWRSRYLENGIWTTLKGEFRESKEILDDSSDEEPFEGHPGAPSHGFSPNSADLLLFGSQTPSGSLRSLHPQPVQIFKLWQSYLDNINPLVKVFHAPSVQQIISTTISNMDDIPKNVEALMFGIYCITVESLSDGDCQRFLGEPKSIITQRFRFGAQHALINASLIKTSDLMVLKAFTLFILSLQNYDARVIWIFSGIAQRIGQRIGLHRDGENLKIPPFETEMRRRLWWQIMMLEGFSQKLAGTGSSGAAFTGDVKMPSNFNDSDLFLGMKELPKEHDGATEMMFFLIRCFAAEFLKRSADGHVTFDGVWNKLTTNAVEADIKDKAIDELDAIFQRKFLRYCDPSITWHLMCSHLGKTIIFMMRFMARSTDYHKANMAQSQKDLLFDLALQILASQNLAYTMKEMQGFMWHVNLHFQWKAFIFIVSELRHQTQGSQVELAWKEVEKTYQFHPSFDKELSKRALPIAVSNLTLKAWEAYIAAQGVPASGEPVFVQLIRLRQKRTKGSKDLSGQSSTAETPSPAPPTNGKCKSSIEDTFLAYADPSIAFDWNTADLNASLGIPSTLSDTLPLDYPEHMNWSSWDSLLVDFQMDDYNENPTDLSAFNFALQ